MQIKKKILALVSCCVLNANLIGKPLNSYEKSAAEVLEIYARVYGMPVAIGTGLTAVGAGIPAVAISAFKFAKSRSKFLDILKKYMNKSFKVVKWIGAALALFATEEFLRWHLSLTPEDHVCGLEYLVFGEAIAIPGITGLTSWIGQKLTEDKKITIDDKNEEVMK